jgi:U3 small nucleolar RNA-associated protein 22
LNESLQFEIHIIPAAPETLFTETKLRPSKNSIRPKHEQDKGPTTAPPSPFYNASIQSDCSLESYLKLIHSGMKQASGFKDACILGRIWLRQRGFGSSISNGGFGNFEWAALSALLLKGGGPKGHGLLSPGYSSYQMFKAVVKFLSTVDLANKPIVYEASDFLPAKSDVPTFFDGPRGHNIFFKMTPWSYRLLREEATTSVEMLNDTTFNQFESTFIVRTAQSLQKFDCLVRVPIPAEPSETSSCDHEQHITSFSNRLYNVLQEGLTNRVRLIYIKGADLPSWSIKAACPNIPDQSSVLVAVLFDPANADRLVDHGPPAEEKRKAAKFQKFWGEKAELRRFKDGSILESLVWSPGSTYAIFQDMFNYLTTRHFGAETSKSLIFMGEEFEKLLPGHRLSTKSFEALKQAFTILEKQMQELEGLPLKLRQLSATSPQLRYSDLDVPIFSPHQPLEKPAHVLVQFEGSGRWPDDIVAIQRTKIAFLLKIKALLQDFDESITTNLGLENEDKPLENCVFLDIIYETGASFRLRIHNDREQTLLDRRVKDKFLPQHIKEDAVSSLSTYKRNFLQLPLHTQSIATHCTRFPFLSSTIRLMKLWFDSHMLSRHVGEELIELLAVRIFLQPYPWQAPSSAMTGFLRTILFLSRWDWRSTPLIVDFTGTMTTQEVASINTRLEAWRKIDPGMSRTVIFAATNHDSTGTAFTAKGPSKMVAARMTALARSACKLLKNQTIDLNPKSLFATSTADYDFVIHLAPKFASGFGRKDLSKHKYKNLEVQTDVDLRQVGFQPVQLYLHELEKLYGSTIVFFHSTTAGSIVAGLWNPQTVASRMFKVNLAYASKPVAGTSGEDVELDKAAVLAEIERLGGDMVSRIEVRR